ncbi:hypothetical protein OTB20_34395 [Streptomyces sp. H27-H1]|uniref:hypothetical protein n=1 Tax=Streptomyces sp. H27-H1 TaxID=2996461 RepID=UPI0022710979|nr:hypothetical protein [Streptomyces sp. H27-H1]MCY0931186.1 hypothetical protein [Streptomyces sp. H27-H1]
MAELRISRDATIATAREALAASKAMNVVTASDSDLCRSVGSLEYTVEALLRVIDELAEQ